MSSKPDLKETHLWKSRTVRPAFGERLSVSRIRVGVNTTWEKPRLRRLSRGREGEPGSLRSSEERERAAVVVSAVVAEDKGLEKWRENGGGG